jgi:hypothetical protein
VDAVLAPYRVVESPSSPACYLTSALSSCSAPNPATHTLFSNPLTVSLCLSQRGFFSPCFLPSMTSHLGYPSGTSEKLSSPKCHCLTFSSPHTLGLSREVQEDGSVTAVLQDSLDERYLVPSSCGDLSEFHQPPNSPVTLSEEHLLCSAMNPSGEYTHCKENKG